MKKSHLIGGVCAVLFSFITVSANATLHGRLPLTPGGTDYQAAYDDVLDITWSTNANINGFATWVDQVAWASNLDYLGFDDWRLASMSVSAGLPTGTTTSPVDCEFATELDCRDNELGYMYRCPVPLLVRYGVRAQSSQSVALPLQLQRGPGHRR